mgnify:CR=1 FL=1
MYKIARIAFKTLSRRILLVYHVCFCLHARAYVREKTKKETEKIALESSSDQFSLFQKKDEKKSLQRALFSLDAVFFFGERQKKRELIAPPSYRLI